MSETGIALDETTQRTFESIREALAKDNIDPFDRDAFLMQRSVVEMIHGGHPTGELGEAIGEFTALAHLVYLFWACGQHVVKVDEQTLDAVTSKEIPPIRRSGPELEARDPPACFVSVARRRMWASPTDLGPEPLDGWYAARRGDHLMVAAQFGGRPDRDGASIVAVDGPEPVGLVREDGTPLFSPTLPGGARAGLYSLTGMEELLALAWRVEHWRAEKA